VSDEIELEEQFAEQQFLAANVAVGHFLPCHLSGDATAMPPKAATSGVRYRG
jgi:hypothetical protein